MESVFPIELGPLFSPALSRGKTSPGQPGVKLGMIERIIEPGRFIVALDEGLKIEARGSIALKTGSQVQILFRDERLPLGEKVKNSGFPITKVGENGFQWSAFIPLAFGGKRATAQLEVFVEKRVKGFLDKGVPAVYFVFTVETEKQGETQWSIHLRGRQLLLQVYRAELKGKIDEFKKLVEELEKALKKAGFVLLGPTAFLTQPFKIPAGFRLNVRG
jgi:hypothetical protein